MLKYIPDIIFIYIFAQIVKAKINPLKPNMIKNSMQKYTCRSKVTFYLLFGSIP